ncbi:MAG: hypothetical protein FWH07_05105 [Oscillospiraceae bacterium]|nr:hypothetical protein [Oscillospiraceae bacterium]
MKECEKATYSGTIRITLEELLELPAPAESIERFVKIGILPELSDDEYYDVKTAINAKLIEIALGGDIEAIKYIDELTGESPTLKLKERELDILRKAVS